MSHYPLLREASSRSLGLGSFEHPSDLSYNGQPRPLQHRATLPTGQLPVQAFTAWPSTQDDQETGHSDAKSHYAKCNVSAGHPSKRWPRSTFFFFLLRNEVGRVNHITRKASSLARVLISLICQITPPETWSFSSLGLAGVFVLMLRPISPELMFLFWNDNC